MEKIRRNERIAALCRLLASSPNQTFTLGQFCERFGAAKSTMSEDVDILKRAFAEFDLGELQTVTGAAGGVRFRPTMSKKAANDFVTGLCGELCSKSRVLPGGYLYLSDLLSRPQLASKMGVIIAQEFYQQEPDFVLTMETKGIPVALMTARAMGVPLVIARRSGKVYEGPAVNINYVTGSAGNIDTMSLSRRAVKEGQRALIVDDFLKAGGTAKGMCDLMREFNVAVVGTAFVVATAKPETKRISGEKALMILESSDLEPETLRISPAEWLTL